MNVPGWFAAHAIHGHKEQAPTCLLTEVPFPTDIPRVSKVLSVFTLFLPM